MVTLLNGNLLFTNILAFISFSLIASVVYIINDIRDVEKDKIHPIKKHRPIASGSVKKLEALLLSIMLLVVSLIINFFAHSSILSYSILLCYLILNIAYSFGLKNIPIFDILILSIGFLLRMLYGATVTDLTISNWLYLTVLSMSFYLGLGKRRNEIDKSKNLRKVLTYYNRSFLDKNMYMCLGLTIMFYSLWCSDPINNVRFSGINYLLLTVPIVMIICMKYSLDIEGESFGDPVDVVFGDKYILILVAIYVSLLFILLYFFPIFIK